MSASLAHHGLTFLTPTLRLPRGTRYVIRMTDNDSLIVYLVSDRRWKHWPHWKRISSLIHCKRIVEEVDATPDLSRLETRERLSRSASNGFFAIMDKWGIPIEQAGKLLGDIPRSTVYKLKSAAGTLRQDELTRISYIVGIYEALHILLPEELADGWITQPNDNPLFRGQAPIDYLVRMGIPGLQQVRNLLDSERGGR